MKAIGKIFGAAALTISALFAVYYYNLDMKLMRFVVVPILDKHYDSIKREHIY